MTTDIDDIPHVSASASPRPAETVSIKQAANELGVHENTVRNYFDRGVIVGYRLPSGHRRIWRAELDRIKTEMFAVPTSFADTPVTGAPKQQSVPQYAQSKLP